MKILFVGGGTMGPVTPLLAVFEAWKKKHPKVEAVWVGTPQGPEQEVVRCLEIPFFSLPVARFPRYLSIEWLMFPFHFLMAFLKSIAIIRAQRPDLVASAGGYTSVPVILAAKLLHVKIWVHQQDVMPILTNKLTAPFADFITVAWKENLRAFPGRAILVGNPVRESVLNGSRQRAMQRFHIDDQKPTVFVFGGGTGAQWLNQVFAEIGPDFVQEANIIHVVGAGKMRQDLEQIGSTYNVVEFLSEDMADAYAVADLVVCRAGLGTMTELAALGKPAVVVPLPNSPQEQNAQAIAGALTVITQDISSGELLLHIQQLLHNTQELEREAAAIKKLLPTDVAGRLVDELLKLFGDKKTP